MITKEQAIELRGELYFFSQQGRISRCRVSGKCRTWKTRPEDFMLPIKYGLYESHYVLNLSESVKVRKKTVWAEDNRAQFFLTLEEAKLAHPNAPVQKGL